MSEEQPNPVPQIPSSSDLDATIRGMLRELDVLPDRRRRSFVVEEPSSTKRDWNALLSLAIPTAGLLIGLYINMRVGMAETALKIETIKSDIVKLEMSLTKDIGNNNNKIVGHEVATEKAISDIRINIDKLEQCVESNSSDIKLQIERVNTIKEAR